MLTPHALYRYRQTGIGHVGVTYPIRIKSLTTHADAVFFKKDGWDQKRHSKKYHKMFKKNAVLVHFFFHNESWL